MNPLDIEEPFAVKEEHSEIFTLRSIGSEQEILQVIPVYNLEQAFEEYRSGHWSTKQHVKYIMFLDYFSDIFIVKHNKKLWKIFTIMSSFIKTRNSSQCRSHHQKNERKHQSIKDILKVQRSKYSNYYLQFEKMKKVLAKIPIHNPIQVQKQKETTDRIPSIKVLQQQDIEYKIHKNPISMMKIDLPKKSFQHVKASGSEKLIVYPREKYIGSEVSIEMEDESEENLNDKVRSLYHQEVQNEVSKEKNPWNFAFSGGQTSYKKDEKLDKTADSYLGQGLRNQMEDKIVVDSTPAKQAPNCQYNEQGADLLLKKTNYVKMKKTRSSLPSFDDFGIDEQELFNLGKRIRNQKKQSILYTEGKCKTLPPRSIKNESEESQMSDKLFNRDHIVGRSLFSGFVSSLDSANKGFECIQNNIPQDQFTSFNNFSYAKQFLNLNEKNNIMGSLKQKSMSEGQLVEEKRNLLYCQDHKKVNIFNETPVGDSEDSIEFVSNQEMIYDRKLKNQPQRKEKQDISVRNFIKKNSRQPQFFSNSNEEQQPQKQQNHQKHSIFKNHENQAEPCIQQPQYYEYMPISNNLYEQNSISQGPFYVSSYYMVPQSYPLHEYNFYKFVEFFIYFMIHKFVANNFYFQPQ